MFVPGYKNNMTECTLEKMPIVTDENGEKHYRLACFLGEVKKDDKHRKEHLLNPAWVRDVFKGHFIHLLKMVPRNWIVIPTGDRRKKKEFEDNIYLDDILVQNELKTKVKCEYQQMDKDYCLGYAVASALKYMEFPDVADMIAQKADMMESMAGDQGVIAVA